MVSAFGLRVLLRQWETFQFSMKINNCTAKELKLNV